MPLVTPEGFGPDLWHHATEDEALDGCARVLVPRSRLEEALAAGVEPIGVVLDADADLDALVPYLGALSLIALSFTGFADGRGFSLARRLRRLGYAGRLRASGPVIADQWAFLRDCGIDEASIDDALARRQPEASWRQAAAAMSGSYQRRLGAASWRVAETRPTDGEAAEARRSA